MTKVPAVLNPAEATPVAMVQYAAAAGTDRASDLIPIKWPGDWTNYQWQVYASTNLLDWQLGVTNVDMTVATIDVPNIGACGFLPASARDRPIHGRRAILAGNDDAVNHF